MKVSIVGGGPAGLYFASSIKKLNPDSNVTIYEVRNESINSFGLGYTLQKLNTDLLARLDENYFSNLFANVTTPLITQALFKTHNNSQTLNFSAGYSVTRFELMRYLRELALSLNVKIKEKKINQAELRKLQNASDLLVGADGLNSIFRSYYASKLLPNDRTAKLRFSWFVNESSQVRKEACFYAFQAPEGVVMLTSYPLTENKQVVIIEMTQECLNSGNFKGKSPKEAIPYLNKILSQNGDEISLSDASLPWYTFKMNTTQNLCYKNITMIGDAAFSFHFSAGQGVTSAFTMGFTLAQCLQKNPNINTALQHYSKSVQLMYQKPSAQSYTHMNWFEDIDNQFKNTPDENQLDLFLQKEKFKLSDVELELLK
jgi:2-polyprenyl-6-methoxyphenol hydroxylase-like FAD-dependent oxidoreductase